MTAPGLKGLLKAAFNDPELEDKLKAPEADVVAIAADAGYTITAEEFSNALAGWEDWRRSSLYDEEN